jgi:hypothetical protein
MIPLPAPLMQPKKWMASQDLDRPQYLRKEISIQTEMTRHLEKARSKGHILYTRRVVPGDVLNFISPVWDFLISVTAQTVPNPLQSSPSSPIRTPVRKPANHRPQLMPFSTSTRPHSISQSQPMPLHVLLPTLPPIHIAFFTYLDKQLEKVDKFYSEREKEAQARSKELEIQLRELKDHRKIFYVSDFLYFSRRGSSF